MSTLRSVPMLRGTLVLPSSLPVARLLLEEIGRLSVVQFVDMQANALNRPYNNYIQRIDEMERIIRFLLEEIRVLEVAAAGADREVTPLVVRAPEGEKSFLANGKGYILDRVEDALTRLYAQFVRFKSNNTNLTDERNAALEERHVVQVALSQLRGGGTALLDAAAGAFGNSRAEQVGTSGGVGEEASATLLGSRALSDSDEHAGRLERTSTEEGAVAAVAGVIASADVPGFHRTVFRVTRGNAFTFFQPIVPGQAEGPEKTSPTFRADKTNKASSSQANAGVSSSAEKSVFVVYHQGSAKSLLHQKIAKICDAFGGRVCEWPTSARQAEKRLIDLSVLIADKEKTLAAYEAYFLGEISTLLEVVRPGGSSLIEEWRMFCQKEKAIYSTLNCFEADREEDVREALRRRGEDGGEEQGSAFLLTEKDHSGMPPTFFKSTEFTDPSQMLVDTYGVPRYQEANPAFFSSVTFPFLFGVMFGDVGHGGAVLLLGLYLILFSDRLKASKGMFSSFVPFRYLLALMGFFAFYAGFLYNDLFALGFDIFGSRWTEEGAEAIQGGVRLKQLEGDPYPFGVDPAWKGASNELLFLNSMKMKLSVLIALAHMTCGVVLKGLNAIHFKEKLDFFFEFIPQLMFLVLLIGYMDFLIVYKWVTPLTTNKPNLISSIITMCMMGTVEPEDELYSNQQTVERVVVMLVVLTVPVMLLAKPMVIIFRKKKQKAALLAETAQREGDVAAPSHLEEGRLSSGGVVEKTEEGDASDEHEEGASDLMIFQMIETIEFVLGTISNTASYLRLWALSLAHQQLALVFYSQTIVRAMEMSDSTALVAVVLFFVFALFAVITFGVILCMDLLEVSLHALRLQWVEFQNKFFKGDGYKFCPLDFLAVIKPKAA